MAVRSGDDRQVCHRLLQCLALARRAIIGIYFPPIPWPMTGAWGGAPSNRLDTQIDRRKNTEIKIHVGLRLDGRRSIILHSTTNQEHADVAKNGTEGGGTGGGVPGQHNTIYLGAIVIRMNRNN